MCSIMGFTGKSVELAKLKAGFNKTTYRGPDMSRIASMGSAHLCFHRLSIMDLHPDGMQPFKLGDDYVVCNGEIYCFRPKREALSAKYNFISTSDCEILLPLYREHGVEMFAMLDAEFALIIYDSATDSLIAARDPIGIRPLFYGYLPDESIIFASEAINLVGICDQIMPFRPATTTPGANLSVIATSRPSTNILLTTSKRSVKAFAPV